VSDGREQARDRLLCYYQTAAEAADGRLRGLAPIPVPQEFTDRDGALAWLDAERASLIAVVRMAIGVGRDQAAKSLPLLIAYYLNFRGLLDDLLATTAIGLDAARRLGDRAAEGEALSNLGAALSGLRRYDEALAAYQDAAAIFRQTRNRAAEGTALNNRGIVLRALRRYDEALAAYQDAVAIFREAGDRHGLAMALGNLGNVFQSLGRSAEAIDAYREAIGIFRRTGDQPRKLATLGSLTAVQGTL
jgi:tetratricopeptide (TPR) repeat protein